MKQIHNRDKTLHLFTPSPVYENMIEFFGQGLSGSFTDQNKHQGNWTIKGDSVSWGYTNVPGLRNTFRGKLNDDWTEMTGKNSGVWQGEKFRGTWSAAKQ